MSSNSRISRAFKNAKTLPLNNTSKYILFSDCHRGNNSFADDFAHNRNIYHHALTHYFKNNFTYIELGDGDTIGDTDIGDTDTGDSVGTGGGNIKFYWVCAKFNLRHSAPSECCCQRSDGCDCGELAGVGRWVLDVSSSIENTDEGTALSSRNTNASCETDDTPHIIAPVPFKALGQTLNLTEAQIQWLEENCPQKRKIYDFLNQNIVGLNYTNEAQNFAKEAIDILSDTTLNDAQKHTRFIIAHEFYDPTLPTNATQTDLEAKILEYAKEFRRRGKVEFADYLENLVPFESTITIGEIRDLYDVIRQEKIDLFWDYFRAIIGVTVDRFQPVIELALFTLTGHFAIKVLQSLPVARITTYLANVITRLGIPTSTTYSALLHAKKFGIQTYNQLAQEVSNLGYSLSGLGVHRQHLIEQRFSGIQGVDNWLGSTNTNNWNSIILTLDEHQIFTNTWRQMIGYGSTNGSLGVSTNTATLGDIQEAARQIYANYPEILEALGL